MTRPRPGGATLSTSLYNPPSEPRFRSPARDCLSLPSPHICETINKNRQLRALLRHLVRLCHNPGTAGVEGTEIVPATINVETHSLIVELFSLLDDDHDGWVTYENLRAAAALLGLKLTAQQFRSTICCAGRGFSGGGSNAERVRLQMFTRAFYPFMPARELAIALSRIGRATTDNKSARDVLSASSIADIEQLFRFFTAKNDGSYLSKLPINALVDCCCDRHIKITAQEYYARFDMSKDGSLTLDEFIEAVKHSYPPYRKLKDMFAAYDVIPSSQPGGELTLRKGEDSFQQYSPESVMSSAAGTSFLMTQFRMPTDIPITESEGAKAIAAARENIDSLSNAKKWRNIVDKLHLHVNQ